jgi:hypothetical protein
MVPKYDTISFDTISFMKLGVRATYIPEVTPIKKRKMYNTQILINIVTTIKTIENMHVLK